MYLELFFDKSSICFLRCMGISFAFHMVSCHSEDFYRIFSRYFTFSNKHSSIWIELLHVLDFRLDYAGISLLIVGSFVPWLYYGFYCRTLPKCIYISMIVVLGITAFVLSLWNKFVEPRFRPLRAIVFMAMGLSSTLINSFITICRFIHDVNRNRHSTGTTSSHNGWTNMDVRKGFFTLADSDGHTVHYWCFDLHLSYPWTMVSRKIWYMVYLTLYILYNNILVFICKILEAKN